jgi:hypothetical protein
LSGTRLELSPSWILASVVVALHAAAASSVFIVMPALGGTALAAALLALGLAAAWSRALLRSKASVRALELSGPQITLELRSGERLAAELAGHRHVNRFMVTLPVRRPVRRTILVTGDMLKAEEFRRLRLWALWGKLPPHLVSVAPKQLPA